MTTVANTNPNVLLELGDLLAAKGLVSPETLAEARQIEKDTGNSIESVLLRLGAVDQKAISLCLIEGMIGRAIVHKLESYRPDFKALGNTSISISRLSKTHSVTHDLMNKVETQAESVVIKGKAIVHQGDRCSLPFEFALNCQTRVLELDELSQAGLRMWVRRLVEQSHV